MAPSHPQTAADLNKTEERSRKFPLLPAIIIALGIILRLVLYFQNRNLIIDEANIVRNLAERDFGGLVLPLKYEQYAPPVFLWIEKLMTMLFGYGEKAVRLYPLLCGIAALPVFYKVAAKLLRPTAVLLPLALFAFGNIYIKYSAEMKQYMPDTLIGLLLLLAALSWDIRALSRKAFLLRWVLVGSLAIWASQPSVFILAGIGCYYAWQAFRAGQLRSRLLVLGGVAATWLAQFALYYETILKPQINSDYLQNYHRPYFLFATPENSEEWLHNWHRIEDILGNLGGFSTVSIVTSIILLLTGLATFIWKRRELFFLIALPVGLVLVAAALNQFSLIDRVILFMMPLWMLTAGAGFDTAWRLPLPVKVLLAGLGGFMVYAYNGFWLFSRKMAFHEITEGMAYITGRGGRGPQLYVHDANVPTYIYYTELHPEKGRWASLQGAHRMTWEDDYRKVTAGIRDTAYFLYTGGFAEDEKARRTGEIEQHMRQIGYFEKYICFVYVYVPKTAQDTVPASGTTPN